MKSLTDDQRRTRQDFLAEQALALFPAAGYNGLTMEAVARQAGVAKGSVFLAFASKQDLVLHAARLRFDAWFLRMAGLDPGAPPRLVALGLLETLRTDPLFLPLLGLVGPVLEQGCTPPAIIAFKQALAANLTVLADRWSARNPSVPPDRWGPLFLRVYALTVGAWAVGETSAVVREAVGGRPELQALAPGFDDLFPALVEVQLTAILRPPG